MALKPVDVRKDYRFQTQIHVPNAAGQLAPPTLGAITSVTMRLSATASGAAIHSAVDNLAASESTTAGLFYVVVDTTLLVTHVLPIGAGNSVWAIWKKSGDFDFQSKEFRIADGTVL